MSQFLSICLKCILSALHQRSSHYQPTFVDLENKCARLQAENFDLKLALARQKSLEHTLPKYQHLSEQELAIKVMQNAESQKRNAPTDYLT